MVEFSDDKKGIILETRKLLDNILVCPKCHGPLLHTKEAMVCLSCELTFPIYVGIPDFRVANLDFMPSKQEIENTIRDALLSAYDTASFEELIEIRFKHTKGCASDLCEHQKTFELSYEQKGTYRLFQINKLMKDHGRNFSGRGFFLDIGCGSGTAIPWIMKGFEKGVGIDYSIVDLIVGSKFLQERGIKNLKLVCADATHLPLRDAMFDFANGADVIEHILLRQDQFMAEAWRVLKKDGGFYFNSPNRYNLFTPEPHVKVRFVGFMPRAWMNRYVQMVKGINYSTYHLLSLHELKSLLRNTFGRNFILSGPFVNLNTPPTDFKRKLIKHFPFVLYMINRFFLYLTTNYQVIAFKAPD